MDYSLLGNNVLKDHSRPLKSCDPRNGRSHSPVLCQLSYSHRLS
jgi:hypothetical protein